MSQEPQVAKYQKAHPGGVDPLTGRAEPETPAVIEVLKQKGIITYHKTAPLAGGGEAKPKEKHEAEREEKRKKEEP